MRSLLVLTSMCGVLIVGAPNLAVPIRLVVLVVAIGLIYVGWTRVNAQGVESTDAGFQVAGLLRRRFVAWSEVESLTLVPSGAYSEIRIELESGDTVATGLVQGRRMYWKGGSSTDMMAVLQGDLAAGRVGPGVPAMPLSKVSE